MSKPNPFPILRKMMSALAHPETLVQLSIVIALAGVAGLALGYYTENQRLMLLGCVLCAPVAAFLALFLLVILPWALITGSWRD